MAPLIALLMVFVMTDVAGAYEKCEPGITGSFCEKLCPSACTTCDRVNETCTGRCKHEHNYGQLCEKDCPQFCDGSCDINTGSCESCIPSYTRAFCDKSCPAYCQSTCDMHTMKCENCIYGFAGYFCNDSCQTESTSTTQFNSKCPKPCSDVLRHGDDCEKPCPENCSGGCYRDTGECVNCAEGFGGKYCDKSCPVNCLDGCDRYKGTCNNCSAGYSGERCFEKCSANCKDKCDQKTGHCIACKSRYQGEVCNIRCPKHCSGICNQRTGVCKTCEIGFMNQYCNQTCKKNCKDGCKQISGECVKCQRGFTGWFCDQPCSPYCRDECEQNTGECIGCIDRYTGRFCNETCPTNCHGNCDQYRGECDPKATGNMMLKISLGVTASLFGMFIVVEIAKRRQLSIGGNQRDYLGAIRETNLDSTSSYAGHKYYEIDEKNPVNDSREMVTVRSNNLLPRDVGLPPPLPSQRHLQVRPSSKKDVDLRLPPPLPHQRVKTMLSRSHRVNNHFHDDVIIGNEMYESVDDTFFRGKGQKILLGEELEHLKYSSAVGGTPLLANTDNDASIVAAVECNVVIEVAETSVVGSDKTSPDVADSDAEVDVEGTCSGQRQQIEK